MRSGSPFPALATDAVEFQPVPSEDEAELLRDLFLESLQLVVGEFDDFGATVAQNVIVVGLAGVDVLVPGLAVREALLFGQLAFLQQFQGSVDGGVTDSRVDLADFPVQVVDTHMALGLEEDSRDIIALRRRLEPALLEDPTKGREPIGACRHAGWLDSVLWVVKAPPQSTRPG